MAAKKTCFAQLVVGPPGAGKTTFCNGMQQFLTALGRCAPLLHCLPEPLRSLLALWLTLPLLPRSTVSVVNVDPANDHLPYPVAVDTRDLVDLAEVMERMQLGPNGGTLFCLEYLEKNIDWLLERLAPLVAAGHYLLFDFPGQVELFTNHSSVANIIARLTKLDYRLCAVHLVDAHYCSDAAKFMSVLLVSLTTMLKLELPHVNVLSKVDLIEQYGQLPFSLDFYTDVLDLSYLCDRLDQSMGAKKGQKETKYSKLNRAMAELVEDFSLVGFVTCAVEEKESMANVLRLIDKANGYCFGDLPLHPGAYHMTAAADGGDGKWESERTMEVQERHMSRAPRTLMNTPEDPPQPG